jgi:hypothetical protein
MSVAIRICPLAATKNTLKVITKRERICWSMHRPAPIADSVLVERIDSPYRGGPITIIPAQKLTPARKDCGP